MGFEPIYDIARFTVDTKDEVLVERARLVADDGVLRWRDVDGSETVCTEESASAVIAAHPSLNEVRPNQITRITAAPAVLDELSFVLAPVGEWEEFEKDAWSGPTRAHIDEDGHANRAWDPYRVLYVNEQRWCTWHTSIGDRLLPEELERRVKTPWAEVSLYESATMSSGESRSILRQLSSVATVDTTDLDGEFPDEFADYTTVGLHRRDGSVAADAGILADWLLGSPVPWYFFRDGNFVDPILFVQLLAAASAEDGTVSLECEELAAAADYDISFRDIGSGIPNAYFGLELAVGRDVIDAALDLIVDATPEYRHIIAAARDPESPEAKARDARLAALYGSEGPQT